MVFVRAISAWFIFLALPNGRLTLVLSDGMVGIFGYRVKTKNFL
jgi:hypothetical protein